MSRYNPIELLKNMGWFSRLCFIGAILMLIDSLLELMTSPFGALCLIFSIIILIFSTQIQDDNPNAYIFTVIVLVLSYFIQVLFHQLVEIDWTTGPTEQVGWVSAGSSGLGFLGSILVNIGGTLALLLIIVSVGASINRDPVKDLYLFIVGYILFGVNLLIFMIFINFTLDLTSMLSIFYFSMITISILLMLLDQKIIGGFTIWIISIIIFMSGVFGGSLGTPVTGFGAGLTIVGNISFFYFLHELGLWLTEP